MTRAHSDECSDRTILRLPTELYLSLFVLFFRVAIGWKGRMRASAASICVSVVVMALAFTIWMWLQIEVHRFIVLSDWIVVICVCLIAGPSDYFLVTRGHGVAFEKQFQGFSGRKQVILYSAAIGIIVAVAVAFYLTVAVYHQAFNLPLK